MAMSPPKTELDAPPAALTLSARLAASISNGSSVPAMPETYVVPGIVVYERFFNVPLDYFDEARGTIQIFARQCVSLARQKQMDQLPFMVYLQGGMSMAPPVSLRLLDLMGMVR
jgi:hypothetical protein